MADTNFYIHFGIDGVNTVYHKSMPLPKSGLCVPIKEKDKHLIQTCDPNDLAFVGDRIAIKKNDLRLIVNNKIQDHKWPWAVAGAVSAAAAMALARYFL